MGLSETVGMTAHDGLVRDCGHDGAWTCQTAGIMAHLGWSETAGMMTHDGLSE